LSRKAAGIPHAPTTRHDDEAIRPIDPASHPGNVRRNTLNDEILMITLTLDRLGGQYRAVITSQARADEDTSAGLSFFVAETLDEAMAGVADCLIAYFRDCNERTATLARAEDDFDLI
jgi:hypothetical protein